jgi:hypothetical protein
MFQIDVPDRWDSWIAKAGLAVLVLGWADFGTRATILKKATGEK